MNTVKRKVNNLKLLAVLLTAAMGTLFQGCADLDPDLEQFDVPPGLFASLEEMDRGILGVYGQVVRAARMTTFYAPAWAGDDMTTHRALNKADFREFDQRAVLASNNRLLQNWNAIYNAVNATNALLVRSEGLIGLENIDQDVLTRQRGEAFFLRGLLFYQLARVHGRIALPSTIIPPPDIQRSSLEEVYAQIESDFLNAEERLPNVYPGALPGAPRPNRGSAKAFLARLYMDWGGFPIKDQSKYALAASTAKEVMDESASFGFALVPDLEELWTLAGRFSPESLFTLVYCKQCPNNDVANRKFSRLGLPADLRGWNETFAEIKFFEDFPEGPRKEATYRLDLDWTQFNAQKSPVFKKITGPVGDLNPGDFLTERNDFLMRYAEVLLIYAEASGLSGNVTPEAWEALNQIRRRAEGLPFATPDPSVDITSGDIAELAFTERKWEFAGEYIRWFDLVRREKVKEVLSERDNVSGPIPEHNPIIGSLETDTYLAPVPLDAITRNPALAN